MFRLDVAYVSGARTMLTLRYKEYLSSVKKKGPMLSANKRLSQSSESVVHKRI